MRKHRKIHAWKVSSMNLLLKEKARVSPAKKKGKGVS
jgi:hypothetical protein